MCGRTSELIFLDADYCYKIAKSIIFASDDFQCLIAFVHVVEPIYITRRRL